MLKETKENKELVPLNANKEFFTKYTEYIKYKLEKLEIEYSGKGKLFTNPDKEVLVFLSSYALYKKVVPLDDKEIFKRIWQLQKIVFPT